MRGYLLPGRNNNKPGTRSPGADADYKKIEPFQLGTPPPQQLSLHPTQQGRGNRDTPLQQPSPTNTPIYDQQVHLSGARVEKLARRHSQTIQPRGSTDESWITIGTASARPEPAISPSPLQAPPPIVESRTPTVPALPPGAAHPIIYGASVIGSHSNPQSPAGIQPPSQPWSNKLSSALNKKSQTPTINGTAPPPRSNGHASGNSAQYPVPNGRPVVEGYDNGREGSIHSEEKDHRWARVFLGSSKEREREKEAQKELTRMIGFLTATASDDWTLVLELCERASANESAAREAAKALRQEFKYADPPAQLSAARLWAIMLRNSNNLFITQTATKKFMDTVESVILSASTSPVVRERLIDVLAAAAFTFHGPGKEGFQFAWRRVRPPNKPEDGIPFDMQDSMFDPPMPQRALTSPVPQMTYGNAPNSPHTHRPNPRRQDSDHGHGSRHRGHRERDLPQVPRRRDRELIPPEEDMRRLFEECDVALYNTRILNEALAYATPDSFRSNPVIKEYYAKCQASQVLIIAQIPWASSGAARSQEKRGQTPGVTDMTKEEKLLAALLNANQELLDVFKCYHELEAVASAEQDKTVTKRGRADQKTDATQIQYISPEGVPIPDPTHTQPSSGGGASASSREPSPTRGAGRPSYSRDLPTPPSALPTPTPSRYGHHHSQSNASVNLMPPPPAPLGPRLAAPHPRSRTPSPERQYAPPPQAPQTLPAVGFPTSGPPSSEHQYPVRHAPPPGPPPSALHYPTSRQARIDSLRSISSVSAHGHGVAQSVRVDIGAANAYGAEADEDIMTPIQPSEKALGKRRAPIDAEPDEEDLHIREETELEEAMLRSQSPYVNGEEVMPVKKIQYVYDAAEERAKQLAAEEVAELAALTTFTATKSKPGSAPNWDEEQPGSV